MIFLKGSSVRFRPRGERVKRWKTLCGQTPDDGRFPSLILQAFCHVTGVLALLSVDYGTRLSRKFIVRPPKNSGSFRKGILLLN